MKTFLSENSVFLKTVSVGLAVLVLIFSLPLHARADDSATPPTNLNPDYTFASDNQPLIAGSDVSAGTRLCVSSSYQQTDRYGKAIVTSGDSPVYFAFYGEKLMFLSSSTFQLHVGWFAVDNHVMRSEYNKTSLDTGDGYYYVNGVDWGHPNEQFAPVYSSFDECMTALKDAVDNPPSDTPVVSESVSTLNYSLPPGNVAFVKLPDDISLFQGVTLRTQMPENNLLYAPNGQLWNSSQRTGFSDSLPTADYDLSQFSVINWAKDGETTVLGLTQNAIYSRGPLLIGNEYMVIVNPIYYGGTANGPYEFMLNGAVQISAVGVKGISVYALDSSIGFTSQGGLTVPTEVIGDPFGGEIDAETGEITWTDPSGGSSAPTEGGNNLIPTGETVFDAVKKIASDFADFLKGPISAIRTVVSAISNFLTEFKSLYVWLPGPVYNLITSAIMVALTIGVVKIFV